MTQRGHRPVDHTADVIVEAWAADREACLEEVVRGVVATFVDVAGRAPTAEHHAVFRGDDEDVAVEAVSEVVYLLDARDGVVCDVHATSIGEGVRVRFGVVPAAGMTLRGAVPKAATYHGLAFGPDDTGTWRCRITLDV